MGSCQVASTTIQLMMRVRLTSLVQGCLFIIHNIHSLVSLNTAYKQEQVPCSGAQPAFPGSTLPRSSVSWLSPSGCSLLGLLLQPFSDSITNTFLWKAGVIFNPLTHSCNQCIVQPRIHQASAEPCTHQPGFCFSLIHMARC